MINFVTQFVLKLLKRELNLRNLDVDTSPSRPSGDGTVLAKTRIVAFLYGVQEDRDRRTGTPPSRTGARVRNRYIGSYVLVAQSSIAGDDGTYEEQEVLGAALAGLSRHPVIDTVDDLRSVQPGTPLAPPLYLSVARGDQAQFTPDFWSALGVKALSGLSLQVGFAGEEIAPEPTFEAITIRLSLQGRSTYSISGVVRDSTGEPTEGALVRLERDGQSQCAPVRTDQQGQFVLSRVTAGAARLIADVNSVELEKQIVVPAVENQDYDLTQD